MSLKFNLTKQHLIQIALLAAFVFLMFHPIDVFASQNLNKSAENFGGFLKTFVVTLQIFGLAAGACAFIGGGFMLWKNGKNQGGQKFETANIVWTFIAAVVLASVGVGLQFAKSSIFGDDAKVIKPDDAITFK